jgi:hypothetical protein
MNPSSSESRDSQTSNPITAGEIVALPAGVVVADGQHFTLPLQKGALHIIYPSDLADGELEEVLGMLTMVTKRLKRQVKSTSPATE